MFHRDNGSSIYSRSSGFHKSPNSTGSLRQTPPQQAKIDDRPEVNQVDHQIAMAHGSTIALEVMHNRLASAKSQRRLSSREWQDNLVRELEAHRHENAFFRVCYRLLEDLLQAAVEVSQELTLQHYFKPETASSGNQRILMGSQLLRRAVQQSRIREAHAELAWKRFWNIPRNWSPPTRWI